jgi:hypothetical protein
MDVWVYFMGILKPMKDAIKNLNLAKLGLICKFRPKRFHKIDPRIKLVESFGLAEGQTPISRKVSAIKKIINY